MMALRRSHHHTLNAAAAAGAVGSSFAITVFAVIAVLVVALLSSCSVAMAQLTQVQGNFTVTVTNQPASNQFCVGDSISYALDLAQIPAANPANQSDATYLYAFLFGPPQNASVDPTGISKTPRGLRLSMLQPTPLSGFAGAATFVVPESVRGFVGLSVRAILSFQSGLASPEQLQSSAGSSPQFSIAVACATGSASGSASTGSATTTKAGSSGTASSTTASTTTGSVSLKSGALAATGWSLVSVLAAAGSLFLHQHTIRLWSFLPSFAR
ncbi:hypothetical protein DFJ73DRAFT_865203 [Zopfochytrium polystomum]|nr:hypothetical protein DFJ73DRAFT_865203 [Zopfochytrium polystomum]